MDVVQIPEEPVAPAPKLQPEDLEEHRRARRRSFGITPAPQPQQAPLLPEQDIGPPPIRRVRPITDQDRVMQAAERAQRADELSQSIARLSEEGPRFSLGADSDGISERMDSQQDEEEEGAEESEDEEPEDLGPLGPPPSHRPGQGRGPIATMVDAQLTQAQHYLQTLEQQTGNVEYVVRINMFFPLWRTELVGNTRSVSGEGVVR